MKRVSLFIFTLACILFVDSCSDSNDWHAPFPYELLDTDPEEAYTRALDLREQSESNHYLPGLVESNYILGHIHYKKEEYDKAITHNLEAIHYAEKDPWKFADNLVSLYKNCGVIYKHTESYRLAKESYEKAIRMAELSGNIKQVVSLSFSLSFVFGEQGEYKRAIVVLNNALTLAETGSKKYFQILNDLGIRYRELKDYESAISTFKRLIAELPLDQVKRRAYTFNNMAKTYWAMREPDQALTWYEKAITGKSKSSPDHPSLFSSLYGMGEAYTLMGDLEKAKKYFSEAEPFITSETCVDPGHFELYKAQAELSHQLGDAEKAFQYQALYSSCRDERDAIRERYKEEMKRYNMELLTEQVMDRIEAKEAKKEQQRSNQQWVIMGLVSLSGLQVVALVAVILHARRRRKALYRLLDDAYGFEG